MQSEVNVMECILFEKYPDLKKGIAWVPLGDFPTPVRKLERLGQKVGYPNIWVKDDGRSSQHYGGNKVRKLEFILADAVRRKKKTIMTYGGLGTNHGLATTIFGNRLGLKTILVLVDQPVTDHVQENLLLFQHFGAEISYAKDRAGATFNSIRYFLTRPGIYYLPAGGSSPLGTLGFVTAAFELKKQVDAGELPEPKYIFVALGSKGTMAGLVAGSRLAGLNSTIIGVRVAYHWLANEKATAKLASSAINLMRKYDNTVPAIEFRESDIHVMHGFCGEGYGYPTREGREALELLRETEDINLDLTYTAKTFAALLDFVKIGRELDGAPILYWHTYNAVDLTRIVKEYHDYTKLPEPCHKFFETNLIPYLK